MNPKTQHTIHDLQCNMADMTFQKYQKELYSLRNCPDEYSEDDMEEDKLLLGLLQSGEKYGDVRHPKVSLVPPLCGATNQVVQDNFYHSALRPIFEFVQSTPTGVWLITHSLGYSPQVTLRDFSGNPLFGQITVINTNTIEITFTSLVSGKAYLYPPQ